MNRNNVYKAGMLNANELDAFGSIFSKIVEDCGIMADYYSYNSEEEKYNKPVSIYLFPTDDLDQSRGKFDANVALNVIIPSESLKEYDIIPTRSDKVVYSSIPFYVKKLTFLDKNQNIVNDFDNSFLIECDLLQKTNLLRNTKLQ